MASTRTISHLSDFLSGNQWWLLEKQFHFSQFIDKWLCEKSFCFYFTVFMHDGCTFSFQFVIITILVQILYFNPCASLYLERPLFQQTDIYLTSIHQWSLKTSPEFLLCFWFCYWIFAFYTEFTLHHFSALHLIQGLTSIFIFRRRCNNLYSR